MRYCATWGTIRICDIYLSIDGTNFGLQRTDPTISNYPKITSVLHPAKVLTDQPKLPALGGGVDLPSLSDLPYPGA